MAYWKTGFRTINGHRRKVRLLVEQGRVVDVRRAGNVVRTDKSARKIGLYHVPKYRNTPQRDARRGGHHKRVLHAFFLAKPKSTQRSLIGW